MRVNTQDRTYHVVNSHPAGWDTHDTTIEVDGADTFGLVTVRADGPTGWSMVSLTPDDAVRVAWAMLDAADIVERVRYAS